jgi:hypothetical protein
MSKFIKYNGVAFNADWVRTKSLKEFSEHEKHHGFAPEQYKEVHDICTGKVKPAAKEETPAEEAKN